MSHVFDRVFCEDVDDSDGEFLFSLKKNERLVDFVLCEGVDCGEGLALCCNDLTIERRVGRRADESRKLRKAEPERSTVARGSLGSQRRPGEGCPRLFEGSEGEMAGAERDLMGEAGLGARLEPAERTFVSPSSPGGQGSLRMSRARSERWAITRALIDEVEKVLLRERLEAVDFGGVEREWASGPRRGAGLGGGRRSKEEVATASGFGLGRKGGRRVEAQGRLGNAFARETSRAGVDVRRDRKSVV